MWPFRLLLFSQASCELVANCTDSSLKLDSLPISPTYPLQENSHKYMEIIKEITIKFDTELKPTQVSWKLQLYRYDHFFFNKIWEAKKWWACGKNLIFFSFFLFWLAFSLFPL